MSLLSFICLGGCSRESNEQTGRSPDVAQTRTAQADTAQADAAETHTADSIAVETPAMLPPAADTFPTPTLQADPVGPMPMQASVNRSLPAPMSSSASSSSASPVPAGASSTGPFSTLPAGSQHDSQQGYATVQVFYATDRARDLTPLSSYNVTGNRDAFLLLGGCATVFFVLAIFNWVCKRTGTGFAFCGFGGVAAASATAVLLSGTAKIEKHGVTYNANRGSLVKGICSVTVPDTHQVGVVERPSLLKFEIHENQKDHIVLTSAIELPADEFSQALAQTVAASPQQDMLVFIHGYNVDFESAVQRTAQISVDLPFEGVPVCYSWPSQGTLLGYTVDENNAAWTQTHLKQFLLELANESGARSINVVAHSMGNRPTTGAMQQIAWEQQHAAEVNQTDPRMLFDRVVLAAPDVDADLFRRDLAPALSDIAKQVTLYASSDDQALVASKQVHGYPRAGESGVNVVVVPGIETVDVSGIDLSLLGHSYYGDNRSMLYDLYEVVRERIPAANRQLLTPRSFGELTYWQLQQHPTDTQRLSAQPSDIR
ncbi:alpha/beta hydrolase [Stieleria tagensis]|uniref:alpha/beta hydrolase n=1 Tax=Stieleria tagensis TaxID=2956795 RepID=UPI00209B5A5B|nr:alpha/beta hydrolase [Stieleria tagensis]